jgi:hypothetical protein
VIADSFIEDFRKLVRRVLNDRDFIDFRARYAARVTAQSGMEVDVVFDDERLPAARRVPLSWIPGATVTVQPGTRVTVGWRGGDEREPYAVLEWVGGGGLTSATVVASSAVTFTTPIVTASATLKAGHLANNYSPGSVTPGTAMGGGTVTSRGGGDILCSVTFTEGGTPGAGPLFTLAFHEAFSSAPQVVVVSDGGTDATVGTTTANDVIIETTKTLTNGNSYTVKLLIVG